MSGQVPEWLFAVCLVLAVVAGFAGGYAWCGVARRLRRRRELDRLRRRFERAAQEPPVVLR